MMPPAFTAEWAAERLSVLDGAGGGRRHRSRMSEHPAIRLIAFIEIATGLRRNAIRALLLAATGGHREGADYVKRPSVFLDWCYGTRPVPAWACEVIAEAGLSLLVGGRIPAQHRPGAVSLLREVVHHVAGGEARLQWLLSATVTLQAG